MRLLELWFPGPLERAPYHLGTRQLVPYVTEWDRQDLQALFSNRRVPQHAALSACPAAWQSSTLQVGLLINGYSPEDGLWDGLTEAWKSYDLILVHWQGPEQIAWCLHALWSFRLRFSSPRIVLWGRHTSYGRDISSDLKRLEQQTVLMRLFDAIICSSQGDALAGLLHFYATKETAQLNQCLLVEDYKFVFYKTQPAAMDEGETPLGRDLYERTNVWSGLGMPTELTAEAAFIRCQATNPRDQIEIFERLEQWQREGKQLRVQMPIAYPWLAVRRKKELKAFVDQMPNLEVVSFHNYSPQPLFDLPDAIEPKTAYLP